MRHGEELLFINLSQDLLKVFLAGCLWPGLLLPTMPVPRSPIDVGQVLWCANKAWCRGLCEAAEEMGLRERLKTACNHLVLGCRSVPASTQHRHTLHSGSMKSAATLSWVSKRIQRGLSSCV